MVDRVELERFYRTLEVQTSASVEDIRIAYRELSQVWHPDRFASSPALQARAELRQRELNEAYNRIKEAPLGRPDAESRSDPGADWARVRAGVPIEERTGRVASRSPRGEEAQSHPRQPISACRSAHPEWPGRCGRRGVPRRDPRGWIAAGSLPLPARDELRTHACLARAAPVPGPASAFLSAPGGGSAEPDSLLQAGLLAQVMRGARANDQDFGRAASRRSTASSCDSLSTSNGLTRWWSKPAARERWRSCSWPQPVRAIKRTSVLRGGTDPAGDLVSVHLRHSNVEEDRVRTEASRGSPGPRAPLWATETVAPSAVSRTPSVSAASRLSSTTRTPSRGNLHHLAVLWARLELATVIIGSSTTNSLPSPEPALLASTLPPCRATRLRTRVSPMPRPPWAATIGSVDLREHVEHGGELSGGNADAVVANGDDGACRPRRVTESADVAARRSCTWRRW